MRPYVGHKPPRLTAGPISREADACHSFIFPGLIRLEDAARPRGLCRFGGRYAPEVDDSRSGCSKPSTRQTRHPQHVAECGPRPTRGQGFPPPTGESICPRFQKSKFQVPASRPGISPRSRASGLGSSASLMCAAFRTFELSRHRSNLPPVVLKSWCRIATAQMATERVPWRVSARISGGLARTRNYLAGIIKQGALPCPSSPA